MCSAVYCTPIYSSFAPISVNNLEFISCTGLRSLGEKITELIRVCIRVCVSMCMSVFDEDEREISPITESSISLNLCLFGIVSARAKESCSVYKGKMQLFAYVFVLILLSNLFGTTSPDCFCVCSDERGLVPVWLEQEIAHNIVSAKNDHENKILAR